MKTTRYVVIRLNTDSAVDNRNRMNVKNNEKFASQYRLSGRQ